MRDVEGLDFHREGGVATVRLNRPERLNALTWTMLEGLTDFTEACSRDETIRVMVITGMGRAFSSGDDIVEGMGEMPARHGDPGGLRTDLGLHHAPVNQLRTMHDGTSWTNPSARDMMREVRHDAMIPHRVSAGWARWRQSASRRIRLLSPIPLTGGER